MATRRADRPNHRDPVTEKRRASSVGVFLLFPHRPSVLLPPPQGRPDGPAGSTQAAPGAHASSRLFSQSLPLLLTIARAQMYNDADESASEDFCRNGATMTNIWTLLIAGGTMGMIALIFFLWGVKNGAFENAEDAKYIVFRDEEDD